MTKKLNTEDVEAITTLKTKFQENYSSIGLLSIDEYALQEQLTLTQSKKKSALEEFDRLRTEEQQLMAKLKDTYGDGEINLADGTFTAAN
jgi:TolA-binding protein